MKIPEQYNKTGSFTAYLTEKGYAPTTVQNLHRSLLLFLSWLDGEHLESEQVRHADVLGYIKSCQQRGVTQKTIDRYIRAVKFYYDYSIAVGRCTRNPVSGIKIQGVIRRKLYYIFSPHELHRMYSEYDPEKLPEKRGRTKELHLMIEKRNRVMLGLMVYQGVATRTLSHITVEDIDLRGGKITIPGSKRSNSRVLALESHQVLDLYDYVLQVRKEIVKKSGVATERLFVSPFGGEKLSNYVTALMRILRDRESKLVNVEQLRASVIVKWLKMHNLREAQYKAGHRYVSSTESYLMNEHEGLAKEIDRYHPLG